MFSPFNQFSILNFGWPWIIALNLLIYEDGEDQITEEETAVNLHEK